MKTNIAQRKKKRPPSSFNFSRTGTFDASGSLFFATRAPRSICCRSTPTQMTAQRSIGRRDAKTLVLRGPDEDEDAEDDAIDGERDEAAAADPGHQAGDAGV